MIEVACALIRKGNKYLCLQRSSKMSLPLKWEFPGGKLEKLETAEDCIVREILEELSLEIKVINVLKSNVHEYSKDKVIKLIPFVCEIVNGEIILLEHQKYTWLELNELSRLDWAAADFPIVEELLKFKL